MIKIYHNPRCSKSREALSIVEQFAQRHTMPLEIVEYLENPPAKDQLAVLLAQLDTPLQAMVRDNEDEYAAMGLSQADDATLLEALAGCPKLLQRPIVVYQDKALIARPPEVLNDFLRLPG